MRIDLLNATRARRELEEEWRWYDMTLVMIRRYGSPTIHAIVAAADKLAPEATDGAPGGGDGQWLE